MHWDYAWLLTIYLCPEGHWLTEWPSTSSCCSCQPHFVPCEASHRKKADSVAVVLPSLLLLQLLAPTVESDDVLGDAAILLVGGGRSPRQGRRVDGCVHQDVLRRSPRSCGNKNIGITTLSLIKHTLVTYWLFFANTGFIIGHMQCCSSILTCWYTDINYWWYTDMLIILA